jgi:hypothetical protein
MVADWNGTKPFNLTVEPDVVVSCINDKADGIYMGELRADHIDYQNDHIQLNAKLNDQAEKVIALIKAGKVFIWKMDDLYASSRTFSVKEFSPRGPRMFKIKAKDLQEKFHQFESLIEGVGVTVDSWKSWFKVNGIRSGKDIDKLLNEFRDNSHKLISEYTGEPFEYDEFINEELDEGSMRDYIEEIKQIADGKLKHFSSIRTKKFSEIKSEDEFRKYAHTVMKEAHGDNYSEEVTNKVVDDLIKDNPNAEWGELVGRLTSGFGQKNFSLGKDTFAVIYDQGDGELDEMHIPCVEDKDMIEVILDKINRGLSDEDKIKKSDIKNHKVFKADQDTSDIDAWANECINGKSKGFSKLRWGFTKDLVRQGYDLKGSMLTKGHLAQLDKDPRFKRFYMFDEPNAKELADKVLDKLADADIEWEYNEAHDPELGDIVVIFTSDKGTKVYSQDKSFSVFPEVSPYRFSVIPEQFVVSDMQHLIGTLIMSPSVCHMFHLCTDKYSAHKALEEFYEEMPEKVDVLAEMYLASAQTADFVSSIVPNGCPIDYLERLAAYVTSYRDSSELPSEYQSAVDDIMILINRTLYKLKRLDSGRKCFSIFEGDKVFAQDGPWYKGEPKRKYDNSKGPWYVFYRHDPVDGPRLDIITEAEFKDKKDISRRYQSGEKDDPSCGIMKKYLADSISDSVGPFKDKQQAEDKKLEIMIKKWGRKPSKLSKTQKARAIELGLIKEKTFSIADKEFAQTGPWYLITSQSKTTYGKPIIITENQLDKEKEYVKKLESDNDPNQKGRLGHFRDRLSKVEGPFKDKQDALDKQIELQLRIGGPRCTLNKSQRARAIELGLIKE